MTKQAKAELELQQAAVAATAEVPAAPELTDEQLMEQYIEERVRLALEANTEAERLADLKTADANGRTEFDRTIVLTEKLAQMLQDDIDAGHYTDWDEAWEHTLTRGFAETKRVRESSAKAKAERQDRTAVREFKKLTSIKPSLATDKEFLDKFLTQLGIKIASRSDTK